MFPYLPVSREPEKMPAVAWKVKVGVGVRR
jgi:hypothetical protein